MRRNREKHIRAIRMLAALCAALLVCLLPGAARAEEKTSSPADSLHFGSDGTFTVLILSDLQDTQWTVPYLLSSVNSVLEEYTPDLVVLLGDQIEGWSPVMRIGNGQKNTVKAIDTLMQPIVSRNIPFALVFGNHDGEAPMDKEAQMALYKSYPGCLASDEGEALPGCGTYLLPVYGENAAESDAAKLNLFFFDSGSYLEDGSYACVTAEQVDWYRAESARIKEENANQGVPAVAFQHIVVAEIYDALEESTKDADGAFAGKGYGKGRYFDAASPSVLAGELNEAPCPSTANNGQFDAFLDRGDVFAAVFGHDHVNTYLVGYRGVDLIAAPGATYTSYNDRAVRGVRLLRFTEDNVHDYETLLVPFYPYESISLFGVIPYYLLSTTRIYSALKLLLLILIVLGGLTAIVLLDRRQQKRRAKANAGAEETAAAPQADDAPTAPPAP